MSQPATPARRPLRTAATLGLFIALSASLSACSKPDPSLTQGDEAFKGQMVDGVLTPVATQVVMVGKGGPTAQACTGTVTPRAGALAVRWSPTASGPAKATLASDATAKACDTAGGWSGIVFPANGQDVDDCQLDRRLRTPREYQGPCRWGWVETSAIKPAG